MIQKEKKKIKMFDEHSSDLIHHHGHFSISCIEEIPKLISALLFFLLYPHPCPKNKQKKKCSVGIIMGFFLTIDQECN